MEFQKRKAKSADRVAKSLRKPTGIKASPSLKQVTESLSDWEQEPKADPMDSPEARRFAHHSLFKRELE
jgi:hypothetical protein